MCLRLNLNKCPEKTLPILKILHFSEIAHKKTLKIDPILFYYKKTVKIDPIRLSRSKQNFLKKGVQERSCNLAQTMIIVFA